jgi:adenosylcobinamide-GDP ribazoletransferase
MKPPLLKKPEFPNVSVKYFFEALSFLTVLPMPRKALPAAEPRSLAKSMFFFPLIGFGIGWTALAFFFLLLRIFPESIACLALLAVPVILTGGLHADGFADFCDGFFGGRTREDILRIMKDSRIGAFGGLGLVFLMLGKYEFLKILPHPEMFFPFALAAGRGAQVLFSYALPYAGLEGGLGAMTASKVGIRELAGAGLTLVLLAFLAGPAAWFSLLSLLPLWAGLGFFYQRKIGGVTGDLLGAASEMTELWVLASAAALAGGI